MLGHPEPQLLPVRHQLPAPLLEIVLEEAPRHAGVDELQHLPQVRDVQVAAVKHAGQRVGDVGLREVLQWRKQRRNLWSFFTWSLDPQLNTHASDGNSASTLDKITETNHLGYGGGGGGLEALQETFASQGGIVAVLVPEGRGEDEGIEQ